MSYQAPWAYVFIFVPSCKGDWVTIGYSWKVCSSLALNCDRSLDGGQRLLKTSHLILVCVLWLQHFLSFTEEPQYPTWKKTLMRRAKEAQMKRFCKAQVILACSAGGRALILLQGSSQNGAAEIKGGNFRYLAACYFTSQAPRPLGVSRDSPCYYKQLHTLCGECLLAYIQALLPFPRENSLCRHLAVPGRVSSTRMLKDSLGVGNHPCCVCCIKWGAALHQD